MRKRIGILALTMLFYVFPTASFADDKMPESYAILGTTLQSSLMNVETIGGPVKVITQLGQEGWEINPEESPGFLRVNVDDSYIYGGNNLVEVDVKYFDDSTDGTFTVAYNSIETTWKESDTVHLTGTKQWLVHKFILDDAKFANESEGADFRVAIWAPSMGKSPKPITIGSISVEKLKRVTMTASSKKTGNIFDYKEKPEIDLAFTNEFTQKKKLSGTYQVLDVNERPVKNGKFSLSTDANGKKTVEKLKLDVKDKGVYTLIVDATDEEGMTQIHQDVPFSVIEQSNQTSVIPSSILGVQAHMAWGGIYDAAQLSPLLKDIGVRYTRDEYYWSEVEKTKGVYTFPESYDKYLDTEIKNGIVPLIELNFGNPMYDGGKAPHSKEAIEAYANYCKAVVAHLKGKVGYFEIWNEWNGSFGDGLGVAEYYALQKEAYKAIKEANPQATVLAGAVAASDYGWLEQLLKAGGGDYMDVISFHPYTAAGPEGAKFAETMLRVKESFKKLGFEKPMWISEVGWSAGNYGELKQAAFATQVKTLLLAHPGVVDRIFWYDLLNDGMNAEDYESNFGLLSQRGPYSAKPAYVALAANENLLSGAKFVKEYQLDDNLRLLKFHRDSDNKDILAAWTRSKQQTIGLNTGSDKLQSVDLFGNPTDMMTVHNVLTVTSTEEPVYYVGNFSDHLSLTEPLFQAENEEINVVAGDTVNVDITRSAAGSEIAGSYHVDLPAGWTLVNGGKFNKGVDADVLTIAVPVNWQRDAESIGIEAQDGKGKKIAQFKINVKKIKPIDVTVTMKPVDANHLNDWKLSIGIQNHYSNRSLPAGTLRLLQPENWASKTEPVSYPAINPGETQVIDLPVPENAIKDGISVKISVQPDAGDAFEINQVINDLRTAVRDQSPMTIDGNMTDEEWGNAPVGVIDTAAQVDGITDWRGPSDLSAEFRTKWDADYLYLAFRVTDDVHHQPYTDGSTWQADGIQIGIDPCRINGAGSCGYNELGFALNNDGSVQNYRWIAVPGKFTGVLTETKNAIQRVGDKTVYEMAIPWSEILPDGMTPHEGLDLGFSFLVNDNDGQSRRGWIHYANGIGDAKDPSEFGDLTLVDLEK
ncbi:sugar-binding protein [Paenibacillus sp. XY044]|uniref:sugar-binding protein n=1 Tax=Paenibacillus sp. XY044 TaxID=2026089 RepID=UPI0015C5F9CB|nr:sugar-binding protein [Paenibacillus sp. XY044]